MSVDPKDVTDGFWYVKNGKTYDIVFVQGRIIWRSGFSLSSRKTDLTYIGPVPEPTRTEGEKTQDLLVQLRQDLNLSAHASASDVFRAALALAKSARDVNRE